VRARACVALPLSQPLPHTALTSHRGEQLLLRLIPVDTDPSTKLDRRAPLRNKLRAAIASLPKQAPDPTRRRPGAGVSWADDAEPQDQELWGTAESPKTAEEIVKRSMVALRKERQRKREGKQREIRATAPPRESASELNRTPRGQEDLQAAWTASTRPYITPGPSHCTFASPTRFFIQT
jgi:hypothetical protein